MTALLYSVGYLPLMQYLLEHGANVAERSHDGMTALLCAAEHGNLDAVQYLLSPEGGASISETDHAGNTALLFSAGVDFMCHSTIVQWLLEYGGAQITDADYEGTSVWTVGWQAGLPNLLKCTYAKLDRNFVTVDGDYIENTVALTAMLRVMVLHGGPPESLTADLAPPLQQIVQDGARLRARLPAYRTQRRAHLDAHCPLLPPLQALVHGYEEPTTTDELWATVTGRLLEHGHLHRRQKRL